MVTVQVTEAAHAAPPRKVNAAGTAAAPNFNSLRREVTFSEPLPVDLSVTASPQSAIAASH
jgi:hypothetical protein